MTDLTLTREEIPVEQLRVGDMRQVGKDHISRVYALDPYWTGSAPMHIDHRYLVVDRVIPPIAKDATVVVWR